jgi:hypothetical protein
MAAAALVLRHQSPAAFGIAGGLGRARAGSASADREQRDQDGPATGRRGEVA